MKKAVVVLTASLLTCAVATGVSAQSSQSGQSTPSGQTRQSGDNAQRQAWAPDSGAMETSKLIGTRVRTADGKDAGEIDQLVVSQNDGKVTHVIVGKGGVLGVGEQRVVLRWSDVKLQQDPDRRGRWIAMVDQGKLDSAPRYEARQESGTPPAASPRTQPGTSAPSSERSDKSDKK